VSKAPPLLIAWSPTRVRVFDPVTRQTAEGPTIGECLPTKQGGREAIVAVVQRSTFIRVVPVPTLSRDEIAQLLGFKLAPLIPLSGSETVAGFRLARETHGEGRTAIAGAMKTESLRRIYTESQESGLRVLAALPLAFGSWLAARSRALADCAVVEVDGPSLNIDVVAGNELRYSRSVALPDTDEEIQDEILSAFAIAKVEPAPVLSLASPGLRADVVEDRSALHYLSDPRTIDKLLFSLELPERAAARRARTLSRVAQRALLGALVAVLFTVFAVKTRQEAEAKIAKTDIARQAALRGAKSLQKEAEAKNAEYQATKAMLDIAFRPAQSLGDAITVLGTHATPEAWLTGLTMERGKPLLIRGEATSGQSVAKYVANLSAEPRFRNVRLVFANQSMIGKKPVVQFGISGHVVGNFPLDAVPAAPPNLGNPSPLTAMRNGGGNP
jgi:Tfp pilus assembly protein PilN